MIRSARLFCVLVIFAGLAHSISSVPVRSYGNNINEIEELLEKLEKLKQTPIDGEGKRERIQTMK